jgi:hypothetical protein
VTSRVRHRPALFETWGCRGLSHLHSLTHDFFTTTICDARHRRPSQTPRAPHARCPRFRARFLGANLGPTVPRRACQVRHFSRTLRRACPEWSRRGRIPHCQEPLRSSQLFSSHFSRTLITDLHHNRCEDTSTVHHPELRLSPETNALPAANFSRYLTTYGPD